MKKLGLFLGLVIGFVGNASATPSPHAAVQVQVQSPTNSSSWNVQLSAVTPSVSWGLQTPNEGATVNGSPITFTDLLLDSDPRVRYAFGVNNDSNTTMSYSFTFSVPVSLLAGQGVTVSSSLSGSVTDGGDNTAALTLFSGPVQQSFIGTTNAGVDLLNSNLTFAYTPPTDSLPFGPYAGSGGLILALNATSISVTTTFTLSPNDSASFSGSFLVTPVTVPEPSSYALLVVGVAGIAFAMARRRQNA